MRAVSRQAARQGEHVSDPRPRPSASSVGEQATLSRPDRAELGKRSASTDAGRIYVEAVLDGYCSLPATPTRPSRRDRQLARSLYEQGIALASVKAALLLGAARRTLRGEHAPPLPPVRTLHYFLPVLEEILHDPPAPGYVDYLEHKLMPWVDAKLERLAAEAPSPCGRRSACERDRQDRQRKDVEGRGVAVRPPERDARL